MSLKAALVICWVCLITGAAIASENHRICVENAQAQMLQLRENLES